MITFVSIFLKCSLAKTDKHLMLVGLQAFSNTSAAYTARLYSFSFLDEEKTMFESILRML